MSNCDFVAGRSLIDLAACGGREQNDTAAERAEALRQVFAELTGMSAHKAADALNNPSVTTPAGALWSSLALALGRCSVSLLS